MKLAAVELADPEIVVITEDGVAAGPSPGMAFLDGETLIVGPAAAARSRLQPRRIHDRYWEQLDTEPLSTPHPNHLRTADLAYAQLADLWNELDHEVEAVVVAAPATFDRRRLGLLLGIAGAAGIPIRGLVDSAVAAAVTRLPRPGPVVHVDLLLHRVVVTLLAVGSDVSRVRFGTDERTGVLSLQAAWAHAIASRFVRATRFDPLKLAATEQHLYDRLPCLLDEVASATSVPLRIAAGGREYEVKLERRTLEDACREEVSRIESLVSRCSGGDQLPVMLTHRAAVVPGLAQRLGEGSARRVDRLERFSAASGALVTAADIMPSTGKMTFVPRLPLPSSVPAASLTSSPSTDESHRTGATATHVLYLGRAYPLSAEPLVIGVATGDAERGLDLSGTEAGISKVHCSLVMRDGRAVVEDHSTSGSYLNGSLIEGRAELLAGDRLRLGTPGVELHAIAVED